MTYWIKHDSGECPLPEGHPCDVKMGSGGVVYHAMAGESNILWGAVTAYRPIFNTSNESEQPDKEDNRD